MKPRIFFALWRCGLIALLAIGIRELYGWHPSEMFILVLIGIAVDSVASLFLFKE